MWKTAVNCRLTARRLWVQSPARGLARSLNAVAVLAEHWVPQPASSHCPKTCKWGELETPNWQLGKDGWDWLQHTMWPRVQWKWVERIIVMMLRTGYRDIHVVHLLSGQFRRETMCGLCSYFILHKHFLETMNCIYSFIKTTNNNILYFYN